MGELGVRAYGEDLGPELLQLGVLVRQVGELGGTDEGEVGRVEHQHCPFAGLDRVFEMELPEFAGDRIESLQLENRDLVPGRDHFFFFF